MHDPNTENEVQRFEREVQQKMEELEFSPSEAVWTNVALAVGKEKKRRVPFFWLVLIPVILAAGTAGIYFASHPSGPTSITALPATTGLSTPQTAPSGPAVTPSAAAPESGAIQPKTSSSATSSSPGAPLSSVTTSPNTPLPTKQREDAIAHRTSPINSGATASRPAIPATSTPSSTPAQTRGRGVIAASTGTHLPASHPHRAAADQPGTIASTDGEIEQNPGLTKQATVTSAPGLTPTSGEEHSSKPVSINLRPVTGNKAPSILAAPLSPAAGKLSLAKKTTLNLKHPWEAGFTAGIGVSSLNQNLFKGAGITTNDSRVFSPAPVTAAANQTYTSKIQPDLSFWAGIFVQKALQKNISVSVGLNLHYYSTKVYTGDKVSNTLASSYYYSPGNYLLSLAAAPGPGQTYPYYTAGDKQVFINRYYFLEIPGSIQWQITHSRIMPLFWEGGFSLSYLMSSNALYYNTHAGVYYKDAGVTNKTQFNISTALMIGIPYKGLDLQLGPQMQYGLTNLLNTGTGGQHLLYGGLKLVIIPGKKGKSSGRFRER